MGRIEELRAARARRRLSPEEAAELERLVGERDERGTGMDPTVEADRAAPDTPGPGDSEGARPA